MTLVKICGITNLEDALLAVDCGADMLGFNFYRKSPRYISPEASRPIIEEVGGQARTVGVFVNEGIDQMYQDTLASRIEILQLHGDEPSDYRLEIRARMGLEMIKAINASGPFDEKWLDDDSDTSILLDGNSPGLYGGTGERADWERSKEIAAYHPRVFLAGGLNSDNVIDAIQIVRPFAVDVASGVESAKGKKDRNKVELFIQNAKSAL